MAIAGLGLWSISTIYAKVGEIVEVNVANTALAQGMSEAVTADVASRIAAGDLTVQVGTHTDDRHSMLFAMKTMRDALFKIVTEVRGQRVPAGPPWCGPCVSGGAAQTGDARHRDATAATAGRYAAAR